MDRRNNTTRLHGAMSQKTVIIIIKHCDRISGMLSGSRGTDFFFLAAVKRLSEIDLILLRWGETMSLWKWAFDVSFVQLPNGV